jgi:hypothetical protein
MNEVNERWKSIGGGKRRLDASVPPSPEDHARFCEMTAAKQPPAASIWDQGSTLLSTGRTFQTRAAFQGYLKKTGQVERGGEDLRVHAKPRQEVKQATVEALTAETFRLGEQALRETGGLAIEKSLADDPKRRAEAVRRAQLAMPDIAARAPRPLDANGVSFALAKLAQKTGAGAKGVGAGGFDGLSRPDDPYDPDDVTGNVSEGIRTADEARYEENEATSESVDSLGGEVWNRLFERAAKTSRSSAGAFPEMRSR